MLVCPAAMSQLTHTHTRRVGQPDLSIAREREREGGIEGASVCVRGAIIAGVPSCYFTTHTHTHSPRRTTRSLDSEGERERERGG